MLSWRGLAIRAAAGPNGRLILLLLDIGIVRGASPDSPPVQEITKLDQRHDRDARGAERHPTAGDRIERPRCYRDDLAWRDFHMNDVAAGPPLHVLATKAPPIKGVPSIVHFNDLPEMGRMTP